MSLLTKTSKQRNPTARSGSAFALALRSSYTPQRAGGGVSSSRIRGVSGSSTRRDHAYKATPRIVSGTGGVSKTIEQDGNLARKSAAMGKTEQITDGLLNLP